MSFNFLKLSWLGVFLVLGMVAAEARPPQNAYINRSVTSVSDLVLHVTTDKEVFSRYSRHFSMDRKELIEFLGDLRKTTLTKDGMFVVYNVPKSGVLRSKMRVLKKGTPVFADSKGTAVLMVVCGNPLTRGPKKDSSVVSYNEPVTAIQTELEEVPVAMESEYTETVATVIPPEYRPVDMVPSAVYTPPTVTGGGSDIRILSGGFPWAILPAIGLIGAVGGNNPPPPVPEPASIALLSMGVGAIVMRRKKKSS